MLDDFKINNIAVELRFQRCLLLWDRAGMLWTEISTKIPDLELEEPVRPNQQAFKSGDRYQFQLQLDRCIGIDKDPKRTFDSDSSTFKQFVETTLRILNVTTLTRIGTRIQYSLDFASDREAGAYIAKLNLATVPSTQFFDVKPENIRPHIHLQVDDGKLGYWFRMTPQRRATKVPFSSFKDVEEVSVEKDYVLLDLDLYTVASTDTSAFDLVAWLERCRRVIHRDVDRFISGVKR